MISFGQDMMLLDFDFGQYLWYFDLVPSISDFVKLFPIGLNRSISHCSSLEAASRIFSYHTCITGLGQPGNWECELQRKHLTLHKSPMLQPENRSPKREWKDCFGPPTFKRCSYTWSRMRKVKGFFILPKNWFSVLGQEWATNSSSKASSVLSGSGRLI